MIALLRSLPPPSPLFFVPVVVTLASGTALASGGLGLPVQLLVIAFIIGGWITSVCLHEFGHALTAYLGGDDSVHDKGYLTLNPARYSDPLLSIVLPLVYLVLGGIGLPGGAVYIQPGRLRHRGWQSLVAVAGPLATLGFGLATALPFLLQIDEALIDQATFPFWSALAYLAMLQVQALIFNLLPLPGLDGYNILAPWLPPALQAIADRFGNITFWLLFLALWWYPPAGSAFWALINTIALQLHIPPELVLIGRRFFTAYF